jgi:hypothetical protein
VVIECGAGHVYGLGHGHGKQSLRGEEYGTVHAMGIVDGKVYT